MKQISHHDLMVLIDTDLQAALQLVIDDPATEGIVVLDNTIFVPYGPTREIKAPDDAIGINPPATYFYTKEHCNGNHNQNREEVRPDADLSGMPEGAAVRQAVPAGDTDTGTDRRHQAVGLHGFGPAIACHTVAEHIWLNEVASRCPLTAHIGRAGMILFDDRHGRPIAAYDPINNLHYLVARGG